MIEQETLAKAKDAFKIYLAKGAPLGHEEDVRIDLKSTITNHSKTSHAIRKVIWCNAMNI
jgi:hypothetical protein